MNTLKLRPRDIYPEQTQIVVRTWLQKAGLKPIAFRVPQLGEYFLAGGDDFKDSLTSSGYLIYFKCFDPSWITPTPRLILKGV